jgi:hypothetical protein
MDVLLVFRVGVALLVNPIWNALTGIPKDVLY